MRKSQEHTSNSKGPTLDTGEPLQLPHHLPPEVEAGKITQTFTFAHIRSKQYNPLAPFTSAYQYNLARYFHESKASMKSIDTYFKNGLLPKCKSAVFYRTPAPIIVYYFPYITCLLYLLFLIKHVRTSG